MFGDERAALFGDRPTYPKPWRAAYHLAWVVIAADDSIVAGGFGNVTEAERFIAAWGAEADE